MEFLNQARTISIDRLTAADINMIMVKLKK